MNKNVSGINLNENIINPINLHYLCDITTDSYSEWCVDNIFLVFKSYNTILYLVYSTQNDSIIFYNIENKQKIGEIKKGHKNTITNFRHYFDDKNKRDLILSISKDDNNIKIWNINNLECITNITNVNINNNMKKGILPSACFLNFNDDIYIITSNLSKLGETEPIKVFDLKGNKIKEIKYSNDNTYFVDTYYENGNNVLNVYIIVGNPGFTKSYLYNRNELYHKYSEIDCSNSPLDTFESIIVNKDGEIVKIICCNRIGKILVYDFHKNILLNKILIDNDCKCFSGICLWDNNYLLAGSDEDTIKIIDLKNDKIIKSLFGHNNCVTCVKTFIHSRFGKCLLSKGEEDEQIKLWIL